MKENIKSIYEALHPQVFQTHLRWNQFIALYTVSDGRMPMLMKIAPGFFSIIRDVLRDDAFISISRLTDTSTTSGKPNSSFCTLVEKAESEGLEPLASDARFLLDDLQNRVSKIRKWRAKWLAHTDLITALKGENPPLKDAKVQRGDIDKALAIIRKIMDLFAKHLSIQPCDYESIYLVGDAESLIEVLKSRYH